MSESTTAYGCDTSDMRFPHGMLRQGLAAPEEVLGRVPPGDSGKAAAVASYYINILAFLQVHHTAEDVLLWPKLRERAPQHAGLLDRREGQHAGLNRALIEASEAADAYGAMPSDASARTLVAALATLTPGLHTHLAEEEREILPIAAVTMTQEEWGELPGHAMAHFAADKPWLVMGLVLEQMNDEQRAVTIRHFPPPVQEMWVTSGNEMFSAFIAGIRGAASSSASSSPGR